MNWSKHAERVRQVTAHALAVLVFTGLNACKKDHVGISLDNNGKSFSLTVIGYAPSGASRRAALSMCRSSAEAEAAKSLGSEVTTATRDWMANHQGFESEEQARYFYETMTTSLSRVKIQLERVTEIPLTQDKHGWRAIYRAREIDLREGMRSAFAEARGNLHEEGLRNKALEMEEWMKGELERRG